MDETDKLLTAKESAALLSVSLATLWRHANNGTLPAPVAFGSVRRWRQSEIMAFIASKGAKVA